MYLIILAVNMFMGRILGFRHRETSDIDVVYRTLDIVCGVLLVMMFAALCGSLLGALGDLIHSPSWLNNVGTAVCVGGALFLGTTWMPFIEHLSLVEPGELTRRGRRAATIFAKAIPYLYGVCALGFGLFISLMMCGIGAFLIAGVADFVQYDASAVSWKVWASIIAIAIVISTLFFTHAAIMHGRTEPDWGLPVWKTFCESGEQHSAGSRFFNPLDATIGRAVLWATTPTEQAGALARRAPGKRTLSDYRRFDGDVVDLVVSLCIAAIIVGVVGSIVATLLNWLAPGLMTATSQPPTPNADGNPSMRPRDFVGIFGMMALFLPLLLGLIYTLRSLAERSQNIEWAKQRWVHWTARVLDWIRILSSAMFALCIGGVLAIVFNTTLQISAFAGIIICIGVAVFFAWFFLNQPLSEDSYLCTFVANVEAAHKPDSTD